MFLFQKRRENRGGKKSIDLLRIFNFVHSGYSRKCLLHPLPEPCVLHEYMSTIIGWPMTALLWPGGGGMIFTNTIISEHPVFEDRVQLNLFQNIHFIPFIYSEIYYKKANLGLFCLNILHLLFLFC